jgi:solute carrier family 25 (adenine nucleotide translocator) protein 4/5/6/31
MLKVDQELVRQNRLDRRYTGPVDVATRLYAADGIQALWRGLLINLPSSYINPALNFYARSFLKPLGKSKTSDPYIVKFGRSLAVGIIGGIGALLLIYPFRVASFKYVTDVLSPANGIRKYDGLLSVWKDILSTDGISGLFSGLTTAILGLAAYRTAYFAAYEMYLQRVRKPKNQTETGAVAWFAAILALSLTYPLSILHDRMMITAGSNMKYGSWKQLAEQIWQNEGWTGFFRGYLVALISSSSTGAFLAAYDYAKNNRLLKSRH